MTAIITLDAFLQFSNEMYIWKSQNKSPSGFKNAKKFWFICHPRTWSSLIILDLNLISVADPGSGIQGWMPFGPLDPGGEKVSIRIRDEQPGSYFFELRNQCGGSGMFIPDPGSDFFPSRIPNPNCLHPGSRILVKEFKYFNPKNSKKMVSKL